MATPGPLRGLGFLVQRFDRSVSKQGNCGRGSPTKWGVEGGHNGERIDIEGSYVSTQRGSDSRFLNAARESSGRRCPMQYALDREDVENYRGSNLLNLKTKQSNLIAKGWPCSVRGFPTVTTSAASCRRPARKQVYLHTNGPGEKAG